MNRGAPLRGAALSGTGGAGPVVSLLAAMLIAFPGAAADDQPGRALLLPSPAEARFRYGADYPEIGYAERMPADRVASAQARLEETPELLEFGEQSGYLRSALEVLDIDVSSQVLVFSKTSLNAAHISPANPRALYFNDDTYVGYVPGTDALEVASMDPQLGPVFYELSQGSAATPLFDRQTVRCLQCHDSMSLTGGGVPRLIMGSGYVNGAGDIVGHEGWILTDQRTPIRFRWGGWYVTGTHGEQPHLGNIIVDRPEQLGNLDSLRIYDRESLDSRIELAAYPAGTSDIVALLVLEHQVHVQNLVARLLFASRARPLPGLTDAEPEVRDLVDELAAGLTFAAAAGFSAPVRGAGVFREGFEAQGPFDSDGRSLRELELQTRLFRYPASYLLQTPLLDGLPADLRMRVYERVARLLRSAPEPGTESPTTARERFAALGILAATVPGFAAASERMAD